MGHATQVVPGALGALERAAAEVPVMDAVHPVEVTAHRDAAAPVAVPVGRTAPPPAGQVPLLGLVVEDAALLVEAGALPGVGEPVAEPVGPTVLLRVAPVLVVTMGLAAQVVPRLVLQGVPQDVGLAAQVVAAVPVQDLVDQVALAVLIQILLVTDALGGVQEGVAGTAMAVAQAVPGVLAALVDAQHSVEALVWTVVVMDVMAIAIPIVPDLVRADALETVNLAAKAAEVNVQLPAEVVPAVPVVAAAAVVDVIAVVLLDAVAPVPAVARDALENALPAVVDALGVLDVPETVLGNALADATPTAPVAQETAKGTAPSRALTLAPPLVMGLARLA